MSGEHMDLPTAVKISWKTAEFAHCQKSTSCEGELSPMGGSSRMIHVRLAASSDDMTCTFHLVYGT